MASEVQAAQQEIVEEFGLFEDWMDRYQYIIDLGRRLPEFPEELRIEENRIRGCQSQVWFVPEQRDISATLGRSNCGRYVLTGACFSKRSVMPLSYPA